MSWIRLEDGFPDHPKIIALSDKAFRAHVLGLCYAGKHLTDGKVPQAYAHMLGTKAVAELTDAGLWDQNGSGFEIHDYLEYNPSRESVEDERRKARERRANGGRIKAERAADVRANVGRTSSAPSRPLVPSERMRARARGAEDPVPQPPKYQGRCEECGCPTGHYDDCRKAVSA